MYITYMTGRYVYSKAPYQANGGKKKNEETSKVRKISDEQKDEYHDGRAV
jgi:hypothetical protein